MTFQDDIKKILSLRIDVDTPCRWNEYTLFVRSEGEHFIVEMKFEADGHPTRTEIAICRGSSIDAITRARMFLIEAITNRMVSSHHCNRCGSYLLKSENVLCSKCVIETGC